MTRVAISGSWIVVMILAVTLWAAPGGSAVEVVDHGLPAKLDPGSRTTATVKIVNSGVDPWDPSLGYKLSYHWFDADGDVLVWDGVRTELSRVVGVGEAVELEAVIEVPGREGRLQLQWDVVQEGRRWMSETDDAPARLITVVAGVDYAFSIVRGSTPHRMAPGRRTERELVLRNDGSLEWPAGAEIAVSYHWLTRDGETVVWDGLRTALPTRVSPGREVKVSAVVEAPGRSGRYGLQWDLVHEGVVWFSQRDPSPEPPSTVAVMGLATLGLAGWAVISLGLAMVAVVVAGGRFRPLAGLVALADIPWCVAAVIVKQNAVLLELGQSPGSWSVLLTVAGIFVVLLPALFLPPRFRVWCSWILAAVASAVLYADLVYGRFFGDLLSVSVAGAAGHTDEVSASIISLLRPGDVWFWLDLVAGVVLVAAVARLAAMLDERPPRVVAGGLAAVVILGGLVAMSLVRSQAVSVSQIFRNVYLAREIGVLNFHVVDAGAGLFRSVESGPLDESEVARLTQWFADRWPSRTGMGPAFGAAAGANVVMVQAESLQAFVLGLSVRGQEITPFLNRWSQSALVFSNVTDQTAQGRSSDSELATQVSLLPPPAGAAAFLYAGNDFTGMAGILDGLGYHTLSAVAFEASFWNRQLTHAGYGYSESLFEGEFEGGPAVGWGLNDRSFFQQMAGRLAGLPEPFCAYLLTLSLHHPFDGFPEQFKELDLGDQEGQPIGNYLHTMRFFDRAFEALISELESTGLAERTLVVVWGDHDAGFEWTPEFAALTGHRPDPVGWYQSQMVPLLVKVPGAEGPSGDVGAPAGHQDVPPTVLALLGVDPGPFAFVGRNLLGDPGSAPVVGEYHCWRDAQLIFLQGGGRLEDGECFRLPGLSRVDVAECAEGNSDAMAQVEASRLVLEHDLQAEIHRRLMRGEVGK